MVFPRNCLYLLPFIPYSAPVQSCSRSGRPYAVPSFSSSPESFSPASKHGTSCCPASCALRAAKSYTDAAAAAFMPGSAASSSFEALLMALTDLYFCKQQLLAPCSHSRNGIQHRKQAALCFERAVIGDGKAVSLRHARFAAAAPQATPYSAPPARSSREDIFLSRRFARPITSRCSPSSSSTPQALESCPFPPSITTRSGITLKLSPFRRF